MEPRTAKQDYELWIKFIAYGFSKGWHCECKPHKWVFRSPSGTLHDLSAANLTKLDEIEVKKLFLVEE